MGTSLHLFEQAMFDRVSRPALKAPVALTNCPMRFRHHSTCATRSIWSFKVGREWSSWISAVTSSLVIMMPSPPCQQFMGCRCSFSWDNAGRKSTWVTQMPHGEELNHSTRCRTWSIHVHAGQRKVMKNMCAERECTIISFPPVIDVNLFHLKSHRPSRVNFLMSKTSPRIHHPECTGSHWLNVPADINATLSHLLRSDSQARHFPPSKSSARKPEHELEAQMVLEIIGWIIPVIGVTPSSLNRTDRQVKDETKAAPRKRRGETQHHPKKEETKQHHRTEERVNAASPKGGEGRQHHRTGEGKTATWLKKGGDQAATPHRRHGKKQRHPEEEEDNPTKQEKEKQQHHHRRKRPSGTTQQKREKQPNPKEEKEKQQHHPKGKKGEPSSTSATTEDRRQKKKQPHPKEEKKTTTPKGRPYRKASTTPKGEGKSSNTTRKGGGEQQHHPKGRKKPSSTTQQKREDKHHYPKQEKEGNTKQKKEKR